jgi:GTP-binding protein Era
MSSPSSPDFRSGFVAVMGRPNVGKSTLINALLGQKIAAVSPRPQTTRRRQLGILTLDSAQVVFVDTPGMHQPRHKLGKYMNQLAQETLEQCDVILFVADASQEPTDEDGLLAKAILGLKGPLPVILALNKSDLVPATDVTARQGQFTALLKDAQSLVISATNGTGLDSLLAAIIAALPQGSLLYPDDQITDLYEREIAADLIREAALIHLRDEVPHGISVRVDEYTERDEKTAYIHATLFVERESHKPIVIGQKGAMLKKIGIAARREIEAMSGRKIYLELNVKVQKNWRDDDKALRFLGYVN